MRKTVLLNVFVLLTIQVFAQSNKIFTVYGTVKDTSVKSIEITYPADEKVSKWENEKLNVENGSFRLSLRIPFPVQIGIFHNNGAYNKNFIYGDTEIVIDTSGMPHILGSPIQDEYEKEFLPFFQLNKNASDSLNAFQRSNYAKYGRDWPKVVADSLELLRKMFYSERAKLLLEYIRLHPNSYVALWDIYYYILITPVHKYFDFEKLFSSFSNRIQQLTFVSFLKEKINESNMLQAGERFPKEFFKGNEEIESQIQRNNQYYLVDFWYSRCGPCAVRFPKLKEIYNQFHGKGFEIVSISVDKQRDKKDYLRAMKKNALSWKHVWDKNGVISTKFNINAFPTYILLDKSGTIIQYDIQSDQLEAFLQQNLHN